MATFWVWCNFCFKNCWNDDHCDSKNNGNSMPTKKDRIENGFLLSFFFLPPVPNKYRTENMCAHSINFCMQIKLWCKSLTTHYSQINDKW